MDAPFTPVYQANVALDWKHRLGGDVVLGVRADAAFKGRQYWDPEDLRQQRAYNIENLGVSLECRTGNSAPTSPICSTSATTWTISTVRPSVPRTIWQCSASRGCGLRGSPGSIEATPNPSNCVHRVRMGRRGNLSDAESARPSIGGEQGCGRLSGPQSF